MGFLCQIFRKEYSWYTLNIKIHLSDSGNFEDIDWKVLKSSNDFIILIYCFYAICSKALFSHDAEKLSTEIKVDKGGIDTAASIYKIKMSIHIIVFWFGNSSS